MKKNNLNSTFGFAPVMIILVVLVLLLVASGVAYYVLKSQGKLPGYTNNFYATPVPYVYPTDAPVSEEISNEDDINTLQMELEGTTEGSLDSDFSELDSEASSL